ncbi:MAG: LysR family transcriptional regulator [Bacteroidales bacterium]|nr:LysR family transcriptional regulator [Bacteroidales bacterium]
MKDHRISLFLAVVRTGGFSKAAGEFGISQSAVSQSISSLEKELGVKLLERSRSSVSLTPEGRIFMDYATRLNDLYDEVTAILSPAMRPKEQPVRIATTDFIATHVLPPVLKRMEELTGAAFSLSIYPESTDFQQLLSTPSPSADLFRTHPADLAVTLSVPSQDRSADLAFTVLTAPGFSSKPFAALLQSLL